VQIDSPVFNLYPSPIIKLAKALGVKKLKMT
jgi:hypothetical protein